VGQHLDECVGTAGGLSQPFHQKGNDEPAAAVVVRFLGRLILPCSLDQYPVASYADRTEDRLVVR
jgi:hypothetical protein